ncbi:MAG: HAD family hydrolase [Bacilli bacterium]|nr:HAD family hydrolase [Bacilli bacterium]
MELRNFLIAVDLDGTLVTGFDRVDRKSIRYLKKLAKNNFVVIATGRPYRSSKYYYDMMHLDTPIINYNGALLHHPRNPSFPKQTIHVPKADLFAFMQANQEQIETVFCEIEDEIYLSKWTPYIKPYLHLEGGNLQIGDLPTILPNDPNGAIIFSKLGSEQQLLDDVKRRFQGRILLRFWKINEVVISEFYNPVTSKRAALQKICDFYQIPLTKTIAIGDGNNDIEMIQFAHYSVAMENAHEDLKKEAKHQTKHVKKHGVYYFLKQLQKC